MYSSRPHSPIFAQQQVHRNVSRDRRDSPPEASLRSAHPHSFSLFPLIQYWLDVIHDCRSGYTHMAHGSVSALCMSRGAQHPSTPTYSRCSTVLSSPSRDPQGPGSCCSCIHTYVALNPPSTNSARPGRDAQCRTHACPREPVITRSAQVRARTPSTSTGRVARLRRRRVASGMPVAHYAAGTPG